MEYLLSLLIGYIFGSFPSAYIILKKSKGIDITQTGSGNVGAMNSYEISNSKSLGGLVLLLDAIKGIAAVYISLFLFDGIFHYGAVALIFAVFSHCYNPWLNFKGGRGLATAAGGALVLFPFMLFVWGVLWLITYLMKKDILFANIWATVMSLIISLLSVKIVIKYSLFTPYTPESISTLALFTTTVLLIIFIKHIDPLKELISSKSIFKRGIKDE